MSSAPQNKNLADQVIEAIRSVVGPGTVALHEPSFNGNEIAYLTECINSTYVSSVGKFVDRFEKELAEYTGAKYVVAVVNGTAALHIALKLAGVLPGDEVLIPALTFVATANSVIYCNATPHFVDSEELTLGIDSNKLREYLKANTEQVSNECININTGKIIRAIVPMHTFGHPINISALVDVAKEFNLEIVEDAAESIGSYVGNTHTGTFGKCGTLSFNGNKTITTGGGGAILTNDDDLAQRIRHLATTAKMPHDYEYIHDAVAFNYRMPNINAALGCAQLSRLDDFLSAKRILAKKYAEGFTSAGSMQFVTEPHGTTSNYWLNTIRLNKPDLGLRDELLVAARANGYMCRPAWNLLHTLPMYESSPRAKLPVAQNLWQSLINIPSSARHYLGQN